MLGSDVVAAAEAASHEVTALGRAELDITDAERVERAITEARPELVINCAAWTDVDGAEDERAQATAVNGEGAGNVARAATEVGAAVVYPSTDYVFDGGKDGPYTESDVTGPLSAYGRSKLAGEAATATGNPRGYIARTAWLFGSGGPNFVETMLRLAEEKGAVSVVTDQIGSPTYTGHLAKGLLELADRGDAGLHHLAGGGQCSWHDFAAEIFRQAGVDVDLSPVTSEAMPRPARRPANSVLVSERPDAVELPPWEQGLDSYLKQRAKSGAPK